MESRLNESNEVAKVKISMSGIAIGVVLGAFLFWLTIKGVQIVSAL